MNLAGQNIIVFDLETKNPVAGSIGWNDHDKMGISVGVAFDFRSMDYLIYMDDNIEELIERANSAAIVSGFNIEGFDIPLLKACCKTKLREDLPVYDLLTESRLAAGYTTGGRPKGMKLDDHLEHTFGREHKKTENGADAPIFFQEKKFGRLVSYCVADVKREAKLFRHVWEGNQVRSAFNGWRTLRDPKTMLGAV